MPATIISMGSKLSQMNEKLVERPYTTSEDFESSFSWDVRTIRRAMSAYVSKPQSGISLYKQYEIARLGPKVQNFYKMGLPSSIIIKILPHFSTEVELISWSRDVFGFEGNPEEFFKTNTWGEMEFLREWSVRLTPLISYRGITRVLKNI